MDKFFDQRKVSQAFPRVPGPTKRVAIPFTNDDVPKFLAALDRFEKKSMEHFSCQKFRERPSPRSAT